MILFSFFSLALHAAALSGHASCVQLLLQHSAKLDAVDSNGHTPLFRACERGHTEVVLVLSHAGASVDLHDNSGRSCLHWAASGGHSNICSSLLHHGLPVDSVDNGGYDYKSLPSRYYSFLYLTNSFMLECHKGIFWIVIIVVTIMFLQKQGLRYHKSANISD